MAAGVQEEILAQLDRIGGMTPPDDPAPRRRRADVAELADATDLGSVALRGVEVQILSSAQPVAYWARGLAGRRLLCTQETAGSNPAGSTKLGEGSGACAAALSPKKRRGKR